MACSNCLTSPCNCGGAYLTPQPFYAQAPSCAEDHTNNVYISQQAIGVIFSQSWNIPAKGSSAILTAPGLTTIPIGGYLWAKGFGYFEILAFDSRTSQVTIQNPALEDNAATGTQVPQCLAFTVGPPPCCEDTNQSGIFVLLDFTAPANGDCTDITVTTEVGLIVGNGVQIGTGNYFLSAIKANNVITICNNGEGIVPGSPVIAQNINGQYQYPVELILTNLCTQTPVTSGRLVVCNDGVPTTMDSASDNQVPIYNLGTGKVQFGSVGSALTGLRALADAQCVRNVQIIDLIPQYGNYATILNGEGTAQLNYILQTISLPNDGCTYLVTYRFSVATWLHYNPDLAKPCPIMQEIHIIPNGIGGTDPRFYQGRTVWMEYGEQNWSAGVPSAPGTFPAIASQLTPGTEFSLTYHAADVSTHIALVGNGQTNFCRLYHRACITDGTSGFVSNQMSVKIMTAGIAYISRL